MNDSAGNPAEELRQRNVPVRANSTAEARQTVLKLNALEDSKNVKDEREKKTFGRTSDGTGNNQATSSLTIYI